MRTESIQNQGICTPERAKDAPAQPGVAQRLDVSGELSVLPGQNDGNRADALEVQGYLTVRINLLYRLLDQQTKRIMATNFGLSAAEWRVIGFLAAHERSTVREIATRRHMAKSQISRAATALAERGYLLREVDPENGRSVFLTLTSAGHDLFRRIFPVTQARHRQLQEQIDPAEKEILDRVLARITAHLQQDRTGRAGNETGGVGERRSVQPRRVKRAEVG